MSIKINKDKCCGCGDCISSCPTEALKLNKKDNKVEIDNELCIECGICVDECPVDAIEILEE